MKCFKSSTTGSSGASLFSALSMIFFIHSASVFLSRGIQRPAAKVRLTGFSCVDIVVSPLFFFRDGIVPSHFLLFFHR